MEPSAAFAATHCPIAGKGAGDASQGILLRTRAYSVGVTLVLRKDPCSSKIFHPVPSALRISCRDLRFRHGHQLIVVVGSIPH